MKLPGQNSCESFGLLISASIDEELEPSEQELLDQHLQRCSDCRERQEYFLGINEAVFESADIESVIFSGASVASERVQAASVIRAQKPVEVSEESFSWGYALMRMVPLATAAAVLVGLVFAAVPSTDSVTAGEISTEEIAVPLAEFELLQEEQRVSQAQMLKFLELELRALHLEVATLGEDSSEMEFERENVRNRLQQLIEKVNKLSD